MAILILFNVVAGSTLLRGERTALGVARVEIQNDSLGMCISRTIVGCIRRHTNDALNWDRKIQG